MKTQLLFLVLLGFIAFPQGSNAQEDSTKTEKAIDNQREEFELIGEGKSDDYQTLFGGNKKAFGGYFGLNSHYTQINNQDAILLGGELSAVINHSFIIGFKGYGMVTENKSNRLTEYGDELHIAMGYGGLNLEPILFYNSAVHVTLPVLLGAGGIAEYTKSDYYNHSHHDYDFNRYSSDYFFVLEPGINLELSVVKFMRISTGASYRITSPIDMAGIANSDLNGFNFDLSLKFGWF